MNDLSWYVYYNNQQLGPYNQEQVQQMYHNKIITQDAFFFKVGWKDWLPLNSCYEQLGVGVPAPLVRPLGQAQTAPRGTISGRVIVHNNGDLVIGKGVNISATGIFIETNQKLFTLGEVLKLSVKVAGLSKPFNVQAEVIRFNDNPQWSLGYGLKFLDLPKNIYDDVEQLVKATPDLARLKKVT